MSDHAFTFDDQRLTVIEQLGSYMPGGLFVYRAGEIGEVLYANQAVFDIFGCADKEEFVALTGGIFRGMLHPEDYEEIACSIRQQIETTPDQMDHVEYRIIRKDGSVRWVDDFGHYTVSEKFGGLHTVFLSDITKKREQMQSDLAVRQAVIEAFSEAYHTVWLIHDVETEHFSLYRGDTEGLTVHGAPIRHALGEVKYSAAKDYYIQNTVALRDQARLREELALDYIVARLMKKPQYNINYLRKMDDGSERYFRIEFAKVDMPGGKMGIVCGFKDVDDDVREGQAVQKALRQAKITEEENRRLTEEVENAAQFAQLMGSIASLLSNMPAMSFSKDAQTGVYLACNQAFAEYAHKDSPEGVVGLTDHDIFDKITADHFVADDAKAIAMDEPYIFFEDVPDAAGYPRSFQTTKMKFTDTGGRLCTLGMCVDVTELARVKSAETAAKIRQQELEEKVALQERLLAEQKSKEQQDRMITALASDYRCVYHVDLDKNEAVCYREDPNDEEQSKTGAVIPYLERFTWYANHSVAENYREGFLRFIDPENVRNALAQKAIISYRYLVRRAGQEYYEMIRMAGVRHAEDRDDHIVHAIGLGLTVIDAEMREEMAKNQALAEALALAEEASKAKTAFLSNMSHEIRTPMNAIIGLDSLALHDPNLSDQTREYLEKIGGSAKHLLGLINDILDMSRIESGRLVLRREEFSLSEMLEQISTMVMSQCRDKGLSFECRLLNHVGSYYIGDDMKLKQVLINILSNAVKFTDAPGSVTLCVEQTASFDNQATLKFSIKDTGIGMSKEFLPKVFDSFTQENSGRSSKYGSTGLGMAITKNIVEMMNGTISVESEKNVGTEFTVIVTLRKCDRRLDERTLINPKDLRVLIVDDEEIAAEHARMVLDEIGINADTCLSGREALQMLEVQHTKMEPYNIVLLDWKMPEMDGMETAKEIRKRYDHETTVIILTAYNWDEIMDEALHVGVDSFLAKPLFASNMLDEFERIARRNDLALFKEQRRADLKGRHILLAEDIFINAEIMKQLLASKEALIDHAENGQLALEKFEDSPEGYYDAILMDIRMPEMDGLEATAAIRALDRADAKSVPIIALTANAFDEDVQQSLQVGMNAHLTKPVEPDHLYEMLEKLIYESEHYRS